MRRRTTTFLAMGHLFSPGTEPSISISKSKTSVVAATFSNGVTVYFPRSEEQSSYQPLLPFENVFKRTGSKPNSFR